jgi:uncharacterized protein
MARLNVRVQPGAPRDELRLDGATLRVRLAAPAVDGKANKRLLEVLANALGVGRSHICIVHGAGSRDKLVEVAGLDEDSLLARLNL